MAILLPVAPQVELGQGDILAGLVFHVSTLGGEARPWKLNSTFLGVVMSRDCVAGHKEFVEIAPVNAMDQNPFDALKTIDAKTAKGKAVAEPKTPNQLDPQEYFEDALRILSDLRDGSKSPDRFYLGSLPERAGRFVAHLDKTVPFRLPKEEELVEFLGKHRIGRLTEDFVRALAVRKFYSLARVGFDDHAWFADEDLELLVKAGRRAVAKLEAELADRDAQRAVISAGKEGVRTESHEETANYNALKKRRDELAQQVGPYDDQLKKRLTDANKETFLPDVAAAERSPKGARPQASPKSSVPTEEPGSGS